MKIALITPWDNAWVPLYERAFKARGHEFGVFDKQAPTDSDVVLHGWAIGTPCVPKATNVVFLRRYELFDGGLARIEWGKVRDLICVNSWLKGLAEQILADNKVSVRTHLVYNAVDTGKWKYREHKPGKKIGMACFIHGKKNLPMALQILSALPEGYELHIAGAVQDPALAEYMNHTANVMGKVLYIYGQIPSVHLPEWWDGMDYCLSTSISEGNPNNVIEAMASGVKPIVHYWPGADTQFQGYLFTTVDEAVKQIVELKYEPEKYREIVEQKYSLKNIEMVVDIALSRKDS